MLYVILVYSTLDVDINSKNFSKMSDLETSLLLLKIQTFAIVYNLVFILASYP